MERRELLAAAGATAAAFTTAGCTAGPVTGGNATDAGDEPVSPEEPEFFGGEPDVNADEMPDSLTFTRLDRYLTEEALGIVGTVKNTGDRPYTYVEVRAAVHLADDEIVQFTDNIEQESIDDLAAGEVWEFEIRFTTIEPEQADRIQRIEVTASGDKKDV